MRIVYFCVMAATAVGIIIAYLLLWGASLRETGIAQHVGPVGWLIIMMNMAGHREAVSLFFFSYIVFGSQGFLYWSKNLTLDILDVLFMQHFCLLWLWIDIHSEPWRVNVLEQQLPLRELDAEGLSSIHQRKKL